MISSVLIDHDINFSEYDTKFILNWKEKLPYDILAIHVRKSCGGRTHVKVDVSGEISPIDQLLIRAIMHDDSRRIRGDLERYALDSNMFGLLFDEKYNSITGEKTFAGNWERIL